MWFGLVVAVIAELSWLSMMIPSLFLLIPVTRFPAFIWLIVTGFLLPQSAPRTESGNWP